MKYFFFLCLLCINSLFASEQVVVVASKSINWKELLTSSNVKFVEPSSTLKCDKYIDIEILKDNQYRAKHYIAQGRAICDDDVYLQSGKKIKFNFGMLEIEKNGEVIKETKEYIKIRNLDGSIEKIYKDGRAQ